MSVPEEIQEITCAGTSDARSHPVGSVRRATVLLVEDDKALRRYLELTLVKAGYEVILAADGLEGMKMALTSNADIIVTDAMMPHLSGHEFCRFLKNTPQLSQIPIVMLSGSEPHQADIENDLVDVFLSKPLSADQLTNCLAELLRR